MSEINRKEIVELVTQAHNLVEKAYLANPAVPNSEEWLNKRRLLLADLSLHLTDACVKEEMNIEKIKRYLYSILIIADDFAPDAGLKETAEKVLPAKPISLNA
ncbi:MAG: hypothetical protein JWQ96_1800 [Segetibacter sp.]|nr:hypothetical protein [Segetibacter sp.]